MLHEVRSALVIAPHPDDETLGCGGTLKKLAESGANTAVLTVAGPQPPLYSEEDKRKSREEALSAHALLGVKESIFLDKPAARVAETPHHQLNTELLNVIQRLEPQIVLIPFVDRMIDHRTIFDSAMVATRPLAAARVIRIVAAYEVISETPWTAPGIEPTFQPHWFVDISEFVDDKLRAMACYQSQLHAYPKPRSLEALKALALYRGSIIGTGYAECFHIIRQIS